MTIAAILLAAGESSRMGRPKPLLDWFGKPLVLAQADSLLNGGASEVFVVTGKSDTAVSPLIDDTPRLHRVHNPDFADGKTTSVKAGAAALHDDVTAIILLAVDQPRPSWVIRRVVESHVASGAPISSPRFHGHGGHPLVFDGSLRSELLAISEESQGIRGVVKRWQAELNRVEFASAVVRVDLNTPEAYEAALTSYRELSIEPGS